MGHLVCGYSNSQIGHDHCDGGRQTLETCDGDDETPHGRGGVRYSRDGACPHCARWLGVERALSRSSHQKPRSELQQIPSYARLIDWAIHVEAGIALTGHRVADVIDYVGEVEVEAVSPPDTRKSRDAIHHKVGPASRNIVVDDTTDRLGLVGMKILLRLAGATAALTLLILGAVFAWAVDDSIVAPRFGTWGYDLTARDPSVKPGTDFFLHAVGNWLKRTEMPADRVKYGVSEQLADHTEEI